MEKSSPLLLACFLLQIFSLSLLTRHASSTHISISLLSNSLGRAKPTKCASKNSSTCVLIKPNLGSSAYLMFQFLLIAYGNTKLILDSKKISIKQSPYIATAAHPITVNNFEIQTITEYNAVGVRFCTLPNSYS